MKPVSDEDVAAAFGGERPDALALVYERFGPLVYSIAPGRPSRPRRPSSGPGSPPRQADHTGTFAIPPGVDLRDYSRIDISLQSFDGSTQHSKASVVRGSLPAAALGT